MLRLDSKTAPKAQHRHRFASVRGAQLASLFDKAPVPPVVSPEPFDPLEAMARRIAASARISIGLARIAIVANTPQGCQ